MKAELPDTTPEELEYHCTLCGYRGTYDQREAHRDMHRREGKR